MSGEKSRVDLTGSRDAFRLDRWFCKDPVGGTDMSYVLAAPEMMTAAATDLAAISSAVDAAHLVAAGPTTAVIPAAADEVSVGVAHLFSRYAGDFHALAGRATAFHEQFAQNLKTSAASYTGAENAITSLLGNGWSDFWQAINNVLLRTQGTPLGGVLNDLVSVLVLVGFFVGFFGLFAVLVPIAAVLVTLADFIQGLLSLLP